MKVRFWGVRGSVAVSGPKYIETGGNTSCVEVEHEGFRVVFDGGTGLRALGEHLGPGPSTISVVISHYHWDHIQGVPFFMPAYNPASSISFLGIKFAPEGSVRALLDRQMQPPNFPIGLDVLAGVKQFTDLTVGESARVGPFQLTSCELQHPNRVAAFRLDVAGRSVVYATDVEHGLGSCIDPRLVNLSRGADLLIHDAQYTVEEYQGFKGPPRKGWGHSTWEEAVLAAQQAGVAQLALYHHDPSHDDACIAAIESMAQARFSGAFVARDGGEVQL